MIIKYTIDLRQFNNGESDKITFPTFEQCMIYGMHKLKKAFENHTAIIHAILIEDTKGRKVIVNPAPDEMEKFESIHPSYSIPSLKVKFSLDPVDGQSRFIF